MNSKQTSLAKFIPHCLVLAFAAWCAFALRGDWVKLPLADVLQSWRLVLLATLLSLGNYALRLVRWRSYLARLGHRLPLRFDSLTYTAGFAYTLSPGKIGEIVRGRYYRTMGVPFSTVMAAFFAERLMDLFAMIALAALLFTDISRFQGLVWGAVTAVAAMLAIVALAPWAAVTERLRNREWTPAAIRSLLLAVTSALSATRPLLRPGSLALGFALGLLAWGLEGMGFWTLSSMLPGNHIDVASAVGIYATAVLVGGLSFLPGGLGSTEGVMTSLVVNRGYSLPQSLLVTLVCRLVTLWLAVGLGWVAVFLLRQRAPPAESPC